MWQYENRRNVLLCHLLPLSLQSCWSLSNREKTGTFRKKCPSGGCFFGCFLCLFGIHCGKMCSNQLINARQVALKGSNRCTGISFFLPLCLDMLAEEIRVYTKQLYYSTCYKHITFPVTEQVTIIGFSLLQEKLHFPLTTSLKMDLLKAL